MRRRQRAIKAAKEIAANPRHMIYHSKHDQELKKAVQVEHSYEIPQQERMPVPISEILGLPVHASESVPPDTVILTKDGKPVVWCVGIDYGQEEKEANP